MKKTSCRLWLMLTLLVVAQSVVFAEENKLPQLLNLNPVIDEQSMGLVINTRDPLSVQIGEYYQEKHNIPKANIVRVQFESGKANLPQAEFNRIYSDVKSQTPAEVQAYALTWMLPYKVDCMSITSAFAFGFDKSFCATGCKTTKFSRYFSSRSHKPWDDLNIRPSMALAGTNFASVKEVIDRGVESKGKPPRKSRAYLLKTSDKNRSVRNISKQSEKILDDVAGLYLDIPQMNVLKYGRNLMFYFTGSTHVADIASNSFLPGAMGDHLTSTGGMLNGSGQMSAVKWLEGGATGSYGTVVEPCNYTAKFPDPATAMRNYTKGEPLIEAYWKSVAMPGQGVFIGDPLANPWGGYEVKKKGDKIQLKSFRYIKGSYEIIGAKSPSGPYKSIATGVKLKEQGAWLKFKDQEEHGYYMLKREKTK